MLRFGKLWTVLTVLAAVVFQLLAPGHAAAQLSFPVRVNMNLCPEYSRNPAAGVTLELKYTIGTAAQEYDVSEIQRTINTGNNTAVIDVAVPSYLTTLPVNIRAYCRSSSRGLSDASNVLSVTNCDRLALLDTDGDGIKNNIEDTNCDNFFSPGDYSNPDNVDSDGDGVRDLVEQVSGTNPTNPGDSPRPFIYESGPFDPDNDGNSNPVVWRGSTGVWYIRDFSAPGNNISFAFGKRGDIPFAYRVPSGLTDVGVIRQNGTNYNWLFRGTGFVRSNAAPMASLTFGIFGDNIVSGPWETAGVTNPAVARLFNDTWTFDIYKSDGTIFEKNFGSNGDIPKCSDYDGDGKFDIAVYRPSEGKTYVLHSTTGFATSDIYQFGSGTADHTVRGDYTGDGVDDISFWEPLTGTFTTLKSDNGFDPSQGAAHNPAYYQELQLGTYYVHLPLSWNRRSGKIIYTVVDHATAIRKFKEGNASGAAETQIQWGLAGDSQG